MFKKNCHSDIYKKSFFIAKNNFFINEFALYFNIVNDLCFDFYISLPPKLKEKIFSKFIGENIQIIDIGANKNIICQKI